MSLGIAGALILKAVDAPSFSLSPYFGLNRDGTTYRSGVNRAKEMRDSAPVPRADDDHEKLEPSYMS